MSRRRRNKEQPVSLFPFLSILACVIGVLTLLITALVLGQINPDGMADAEHEVRIQQDLDQQFTDSQDKIKRDQDEIDRLKRLLTEADSVRRQLEAAHAELARLEAEYNRQILAQTPNKNSAEMLSQANELRRRIAELEPELTRLLDRAKELQAEIDQRKQKPEEATVRVRPSGSGTDLIPSFVECAASGVVIYEDGQQIHVRRGDLAKSDPFLKLLDFVHDHADDRTIIFLLREDGLGTYYVARGIARSRGARNGKLPVVGQGRIDLSMFDDIIKTNKAKHDR